MDKWQRYKRVFDHFDENKDGKISPRELRIYLGYISGCDEVADVEAVVLLMDSDGDGFLSIGDFIRLVEGGEEDEKVKDLREAFMMYENDEKDRMITPKSLKRMLSKLGEKRTVDECKFMIASYDVNGDGVLCFDEFKTMMS